METILPWVVAPAVFSLGWYLLGYTEARAAGLINLTAGIVALTLAIVQTGRLAGLDAITALAVLIGIYLVAEGAGALWNLGLRSVGLLAGFTGVATAVFAVVLIIAAAVNEPYQLSVATIGLASALFVPVALIRFIHEGLDRPKLRRPAGWAFVLSAWTGWAIPGAVLLIDRSIA